MFTFMKLLHVLALIIGVGGGLINLITIRQMKTAEGPAKAALGVAMRHTGQAAALALIVLWISGIGLVEAAYDWGDMPVLFWLKIAVVVALTAVSFTAQTMVLRGLARKSPPPPPLMAKFGKAGAALAVTITVLAVLTFSA